MEHDMDREADALRFISGFYKIQDAETRKIILTLVQAVADGATIEATMADGVKRGELLKFPKRN